MAQTTIKTEQLADDAVTSAKLDTNIAIAGTLGSAGNTVVNSNNGTGVALKIGGEGGSGLITQYVVASGHTNYQIGVATHAASVFSITPSTSAGNTTFTNAALNINSSGNVGIGTSAPVPSASAYNSAALHLHQASGGSTGSQIHLTNAATGGAAGDGSFIAQWSDQHLYITNQESKDIAFSAGGAERVRISGNNLHLNGGGDARIQLNTSGAGANSTANDTVHIRGDGDSMKLMAAADGHYIFEVNGSEKFRIASNGNIGANISSPLDLLHLNDPNDDCVLNLDTAIANKNSLIKFSDPDAQGVGFIQYAHSDGSFRVHVEGAERFRITSAGTAELFGNVRCGTVAAGNGVVDLNGASGSYAIDYIDSGGTRRFVVTAGNGNVQNTNNSYGALSDSKIKENIVDASNKLEDLNKVKIKNFNVKGQTEKQIGVIAQELEEVFPKMIENHKDYNEKGEDLGTVTKAVKYSVFVPMLIKALQEADNKIDALTARIKTLEDA